VRAVSVSNHGGNNLDGTPATIRALPAVADAVGDEVEVLLDGGVRRGGDVVKALCLGAKAVLIGRAALWGLAANGQAGVENVLDLLRSGIESTLMGLGRASVRELERRDVLMPPGFTRALGTDGSTPRSGPVHLLARGEPHPAEPDRLPESPVEPHRVVVRPGVWRRARGQRRQGCLAVAEDALRVRRAGRQAGEELRSHATTPARLVGAAGAARAAGVGLTQASEQG
jgi:hypothetical protein